MPSIKKNFLYSSFLTTANYIFPLITYPYVSRVLGVANIGLVNFVDSIIHYFILISMLGISALGIREISSCNNDFERRSRVFNSLLLLNTISTIIAVVILVICSLTVPKLREHLDLMGIGVLNLIFNYLLIDWLFRGLEDFKFITYRTLIVKLGYVTAIFIFVRNQGDAVAYYFIITAAIIANALINCIYSGKFVKWGLKGISFKGMVKPFLTLGAYMLLTSMYKTFNTAFLGFVSTDTEVGYYTTATKLFAIILALFTAFTGVMLPRMSNLLSNNKIEEFKSLLKKSCDILIGISFPIIIVSMVYSDVIIDIISGKGYEGAIMPMTIIMPLMFVIGYEQILVIQGLLPLKQDRTILINTTIAAVTSIVLNIVLVTHFKAIGSSIVWAVCEILVMILSQVALRRKIGFSIDGGMLIKTILIYLPMLAVIIGAKIIIHEVYIAFVVSTALTTVYFVCINMSVFKTGYINVLIVNTLSKMHIIKKK